MIGTCEAIRKVRSNSLYRAIPDYCPAIGKIEWAWRMKVQYVSGIGTESKAHKAKDENMTVCGHPLISLTEVPPDHLHLKCPKCYK